MNRSDFFSAMRKGLVDTIKAATEPFIEEKIEQLDRTTDALLQIKWVPIDCSTSSLPSYHYIAGQSVFVFQAQQEVLAVSTVCLHCHQLLSFSESNNELRCFSCENSYSIVNGDGDLSVQYIPIRYKNNQYELGIKE